MRQRKLLALRRVAFYLLGFANASLLACEASANARASYWFADDGTRISPLSEPPNDTDTEGTIELFALRGETVAFQIAIRAGSLPLDDVTLAFLPTTNEAERSIDNDWIDSFVVHAIPALASTRNGWLNHEETLAWATLEAKPPDPPVWISDALIPIEVAPTWAPYPLRIEPHRTASLWVDIHVPEDAEPGQYAARLVVRAADADLGELSLALDVKGTRLPFKAVETAVFYDPAILERRLGSRKAELHLWQLFHRHHLSPMLSVKTAEDVRRIRSVIEGSAFRRDEGYRGPGASMGTYVLVLGAYGAFGEPGPTAIAQLRTVAEELSRIPVSLDVFLYAIDERCESDRAARWRRYLRSTGDPLLYAIRVGESCHLFPSSRAADVVLVPSAAFRDAEAEEIRSSGRWLWVYNGHRPWSGPLMLDVPPVDLRANGWIAAAFDVDRWFYWESTFWDDANSGGRGPVDPFVIADTFHNHSGDTALGDGLFVYPGRQLDYPEHSAGVDALFPSIRLKNLRRGIQDAAYVSLLASLDPERAESIVRSVLPLALDEIPTPNHSATWPSTAAPFGAARREIWEALPDDLEVADGTVRRTLAAVAALRRNRIDRSPEAGSSRFAIAVLVGAAVAWAFRRARTYRPTDTGPERQ